MMADWHDWATAPRDGTAFCVGAVVRFNPVAEHWETLVFSDEAGDSKEWIAAEFLKGPSFWTELPASAEPVPNPGWYAVGLRVEYKVDWSLWSKIQRCLRWVK